MSEVGEMSIYQQFQDLEPDEYEQTLREFAEVVRTGAEMTRDPIPSYVRDVLDAPRGELAKRKRAADLAREEDSEPTSSVPGESSSKEQVSSSTEGARGIFLLYGKDAVLSQDYTVKGSLSNRLREAVKKAAQSPSQHLLAAPAAALPDLERLLPGESPMAIWKESLVGVIEQQSNETSLEETPENLVYVVQNAEEMFSVVPEGQEIPSGWRVVHGLTNVDEATKFLARQLTPVVTLTSDLPPESYGQSGLLS